MAADEKTEKATPKRKQDERKKGNVFQSSDVAAVASLLAVFNGLKIFASFMYKSMYQGVILFLDMHGWNIRSIPKAFRTS